MTVKVAIIADDLTGALDSAAPFAARGLVTRVALNPEALEKTIIDGGDVLAVSTNSRDCTPSEAAERVRMVAAALATLKPNIVFKKVDSRLKGQLNAEISACAAGFGRSEWIVAPALPEFARVISDGVLTGFGIVEPISAADRLGVDHAWIPDVTASEDFQPVVDAILASRQALAIGARGLAEALAERIQPQSPPLQQAQRPLLFAIGSVDPITRRQVTRLCATADINPIVADTVIERWDGRDLAVLMTPELAGSISIEPARAFAIAVCRAIRALQPATLLVTGGETAAMVFAGLGVDQLLVEGELVPGIGQAVARLDYGTLRVLTKSGGFGSDETLNRVYDLAHSG